MKLPSDPGSLQCFKECLEALPRLHTLEIVDSKLTTKSGVVGCSRNIFKKPDFPSIRKVTMPLIAHSILARFPNMEELVCFGDHWWRSATSLLNSIRGPYVREKYGEIEPVLKSFTLVNTRPDDLIPQGM